MSLYVCYRSRFQTLKKKKKKKGSLVPNDKFIDSYVQNRIGREKRLYL